MFAVLLGMLVFLPSALVSCGGGGGGSRSSEPLTEEEKEAIKVESELSPDDHDVPDEVVPDFFQGRVVQEVRVEIKGQGYAGFEDPTMSFTLRPSGYVSSGVMQNGIETVRIDSARWEGQSAGDGAESIVLFSISGTSEDGRNMEMLMSNITITSKTVNEQQTTYTGTIHGGQCSLGGALWQSFLTGTTQCTMTYYVSSSR